MLVRQREHRISCMSWKSALDLHLGQATNFNPVTANLKSTCHSRNKTGNG